MSPPVKLELELILREIRVITDKIREDDDCSNVSGDWKFAAMVLDRSDDENISSVQQNICRLCLIFFTSFTIVATVSVLLAAPHIIVT